MCVLVSTASTWMESACRCDFRHLQCALQQSRQKLRLMIKLVAARRCEAVAGLRCVLVTASGIRVKSTCCRDQAFAR